MTSILNSRQFSTSAVDVAPANGIHFTMLVQVPPTLDRLVSELAEGIQKATEGFYDAHKSLILCKKTTRQSMDLFLLAKQAFRSEFETLRNMLQSLYLHSHGYENSCRRAPDDRYMSANRCQLSAKALLRDLQIGNKGYEKILVSFKGQQITLFGILNANGQKPQACLNPMGSDVVTNNPVFALYDSLDGIQSTLKEVLSFWESHVAFLKLLVNRQSNFPLPGDETRVTADLWIAYQNAILRSSNSISESVDALDVDPVVPILPRRTWRKAVCFAVDAKRMQSNVASVNIPHPVKVANESDNHMSFSNRFGLLLYRLF